MLFAPNFNLGFGWSYSHLGTLTHEMRMFATDWSIKFGTIINQQRAGVAWSIPLIKYRLGFHEFHLIIMAWLLAPRRFCDETVNPKMKVLRRELHRADTLNTRIFVRDPPSTEAIYDGRNIFRKPWLKDNVQIDILRNLNNAYTYHKQWQSFKVLKA